MTRSDAKRLGRRAFLKDGSLLLAATTLSALPKGAHLARADSSRPGQGLKFGLVTDLHFADKPSAGTRHYRETPEKLAEAGEQFRAQPLDFVVELGDLIDSADSVAAERGYLRKINREFSRISPRRHYVLGNHCVFTLTKEEFLGEVGQEQSYYSFDQGDFHFVVLDACFRRDGTPYARKNFEWTDANIPLAELDWLREDLKATKKRVIVLAHQRLDVDNHYGVRNASEVRRLLEESEKTLAVFQGHSHKNDYRELRGVHYCTFVAMIEGSGAESSGYSIIDVQSDGTIRIKGFRKQAGYDWPGARRSHG